MNEMENELTNLTTKHKGLTGRLIRFIIVIILLIAFFKIAIPAFYQYREGAGKRMCIENLRQIESAKDAYLTKTQENKK